MKFAVVGSVLTACLVAGVAFVALEPVTPESRTMGELGLDVTPTFAVAGDSITAWQNMTFPNPVSDPAAFDPITWTHYALLDGLELRGGFALGGQTISVIADRMVPVDADVLVVLASTNDVAAIDPASLEGFVERIVATSGVESVLICTIPPVGHYGFRVNVTAAAGLQNVEFERMAAEHGWSFVDPWVSMRNPDQSWVAGYSDDLVHPTAVGAEIAGEMITAKIRAMHRHSQLAML